MTNSSYTSDQNEAFRRLVELVSAIPQHARSIVFRSSLMEQEPRETTRNDVTQAIRSELTAFLPAHERPRLTPETHLLDDTRNCIKVAFAIDRILQQSVIQGAD